MNIRKIKRVVFATILILSLSINVFGQDNGFYSISGKLVENNNSIFDFAIIGLYSCIDSVKIDEVLIEENGLFSFFDLKSQCYYLKVKMNSSEKMLIPSIIVESKNIALGDIQYYDEGLTLNPVEVKANKPALKRIADHITLNVKDSYLSKSSFQVYELLNLMPFVRATEQKITIKNSSSILYLLDGKGNRFTNESNRQKISNLSNKEIEKIEVYSNPPSQFDADGFSVINVITVKNLKISSISSKYVMGLFQNSNSNISKRLNSNFDINYKIGKFGFKNNLNYGRNQDYENSLDKKTYKQDNYSVESINNRNYLNQYLALTSGIVFELNSSTEITFDLDISTNNFADTSLDQRNVELKYFKLKTAQIDSIKSFTTSSGPVFDSKYIQLGFWKNARHSNLDFQYIYYQLTDKSYGSNYINNISKYFNNSDDANHNFVLNYEDTIFQNIKLKSGLKYSLVNNSEGIKNIINTGVFEYREEIKSAYFQLNGEINKIQWQLGLRNEYSAWKIKLPLIEKNSYNRLFPSLFITFPIKNSTINLSYTNRIQRQQISELNPYIKTSQSSLQIQTGNILVLKPQFTNSFEFNIDFPSFNFSTFYNYLKNPRIYFADKVDSLIISYVPKSSQFEKTYGVDLKFPLSLSIFKINLGINCNWLKTSLLDKTTINGNSYNLNCLLYFPINKNTKINFGAFYNFPSSYGYNSNIKFFIANLGINYQKSGFPLYLSLSLVNLFGNKYGFSSNFPLIYESVFGVSNTRSVSISARYNFKLGKEFSEKGYDKNFR